MLGSIIGDIIGSRFERKNAEHFDFELLTRACHVTDDSIMTIAVADAIIHKIDFTVSMQYWGQQFPKAGYGGNFRQWLTSACPKPYNSWGNGSAMRVSPVGIYYRDLESVLKVAKQSAEVSHDHPEGIKGAQAIASAVFLAKNQISKSEIKSFISEKFAYNLDTSLSAIRPIYKFDVSCQGSVPIAIMAFLESENFESCIRNAVFIGGDSDTIACMAGGIAEMYYGIPSEIKTKVNSFLPDSVQLKLKEFEESLSPKS